MSGVTAIDISQQDPGEHQYAALVCRGTPSGLFSLRPLPWPEPVAVETEAYHGPAWRTVAPPASPERSYDREVLRLVYGTHAEPATLGQRLATSLSEREWRKLLERWNAIRQAQREHILRNPGCIPDRLERRQWLSRLLVARPRILAEVEYHRQRPAITATGHGAQRERLVTHGGRVKADDAGTGATRPADAKENWATQATKEAPSPDGVEPVLPNHELFLG